MVSIPRMPMVASFLLFTLATAGRINKEAVKALSEKRAVKEATDRQQRAVVASPSKVAVDSIYKCETIGTYDAKDKLKTCLGRSVSFACFSLDSSTPWQCFDKKEEAEKVNCEKVDAPGDRKYDGACVYMADFTYWGKLDGSSLKVAFKPDAVTMAITLTGLDFDKTNSNADMKAKLIKTVKDKFLKVLGSGYKEDHLSVTLSKGSVKASVTITPQGSDKPADLVQKLEPEVNDISQAVLSEVKTTEKIEEVLEDGKKPEEIKAEASSPKAVESKDDDAADDDDDNSGAGGKSMGVLALALFIAAATWH